MEPGGWRTAAALRPRRRLRPRLESGILLATFSAVALNAFLHPYEAPIKASSTPPATTEAT